MQITVLMPTSAPPSQRDRVIAWMFWSGGVWERAMEGEWMIWRKETKLFELREL